MTLSELKAGQSARIASFGTPKQMAQSLRRNLLALGVTPNTKIKMVRKAPLGASIEICIRGSLLCIGQDLADIIEVNCVL